MQILHANGCGIDCNNTRAHTQLNHVSCILVKWTLDFNHHYQDVAETSCTGYKPYMIDQLLRMNSMLKMFNLKCLYSTEVECLVTAVVRLYTRGAVILGQQPAQQYCQLNKPPLCLLI